MSNFPLPFSGLGFDLSRAAQAIQLQFFSPDEEPGLEISAPVFAPWGFGLLVHLNRETRGS